MTTGTGKYRFVWFIGAKIFQTAK